MSEVKYTFNDQFTRILKDGHAMFMEDILKDLQRKTYLESKLAASQARVKMLEGTTTAMVVWLELNQKDVFSRGIWDAVELAKKGL